MKTLLIFALAGLLATSSFASATEDLKANSTVHSKYKKISVRLSEGVGKAKIAIFDMQGVKLHQRSVKAKHELLVPYDLNSLPCGEYQVKITTEEDEVTYTVKTVDKINPTPVVYPLVAYGKLVDTRTVTLLVIGLEEAGVDVKIKRVSDDNIVYEEIETQPEGFRKNYILNGVSAKDVYFEITDVKGRTRIIYI